MACCFESHDKSPFTSVVVQQKVVEVSLLVTARSFAQHLLKIGLVPVVR